MKKATKKILQAVLPDNILISRLNKDAPNSILLTFDDGPDEKVTPLVLECLEKYNVRAMFFVIGRLAQGLPHILKKIASKGHYIANHGYAYHSDLNRADFNFFRKDIIRCQDLVKDILGEEPCFYRAPRGTISPKTLLAPKILGLKSMLWSNSGEEWGRRLSADAKTIAGELIGTLSPRDIVLLHDNNPKVPEILDTILPVISKKYDLCNGAERCFSCN
jgi:peptidoglycan-N-acetylglucosamine deacetylase